VNDDYENQADGEVSSGSLISLGQVCSFLHVLSREEIERLFAEQNAIEVRTPNLPVVVPQLHAHSLTELLEIAERYKLMSHGLFGETFCLFRGQSQDYYDHGCFCCPPPAYRTREWQDRFSCDNKSLADELVRWEAVLGRLGADLRTGVAAFESQRVDDQHAVFRSNIDNSPAARITSNREFLAILQHYGFPTASLDVTTDLFVAVWFALHKGVRDERRAIRFEPRTSVPSYVRGTPFELRGIPSIQIYLENPELGVIHRLIDSEFLKGTARRPFAQQAFSLPFTEYSVRFSTPNKLNLKVARPSFRSPVVVIKLHFAAEELARHRPDLTIDELFPKEEALYKELLRAEAPHLDRYA